MIHFNVLVLLMLIMSSICVAESGDSYRNQNAKLPQTKSNTYYSSQQPQNANNPEINPKIPHSQTNQFRFSRNQTLPQAFTNIKQIQPIDNQTILISSLSSTAPDNSTVIKVFKGSQFQTKVNQINVTSQENTRFSTQRTYINSHTSITQQQSIFIKFSVNTSTALSANKFLLKDKFMYYDWSQNYQETLKCNSLWRKNLQTGQQQLIQYETNTQCSRLLYESPLLSDAGGKFIAYVRVKTLYIINTDTLQVSYKVNSTILSKFQPGFGSSLSFWYDQSTNNSKLVLFIKIAKLIESFSFNHDQQKYSSIGYFELVSECQFTLTGFDQAVCTQYSTIDHFSKLTNILLYKGSDSLNDKMLSNRTFIASTSDESRLLMQNTLTRKLQIYSVNKNTLNYQTQMIFSIDLQGRQISSQISSDDQTLFVMVLTPQGNRTIKIYNLKNQTMINQVKEDTNVVHEAFGVFPISIDRFILLIKKQVVSGSARSIQSFIQIRRLSNVSEIINETATQFLDDRFYVYLEKFRLKLDKQSRMFIIEPIISNSSAYSRKYYYICTVQNDKFSLLREISEDSNFNAPSLFFGTRHLFMFSDYDQYIRVYSKIDLELIKQISHNIKMKDIAFENDELVVYWQRYQSSELYKFEFTKSEENPDFGKMTKLDVGISELVPYQLIFLRQTGVVYLFMASQAYKRWNNEIKIVINSSLPLDKTTQFQQNHQSLSSAYISKNSNPNIQCDNFAFIEWLYYFDIFKNCQPYQPPTRYPLKDQKFINIGTANLEKSANGKYLIVCTQFSDINYHVRVQIRNIQSTSQVLWQRWFQTQNSSDYSKVHYSQSGTLIIQQKQNLAHTTTLIINEAFDYDMKTFLDFNVNDNNTIVVVGQNLLSTPQLPIISITVVNNKKNIIFHRNMRTITPQQLKTVIIDQNDSKVAFCYQSDAQNITIMAWQFSSPYDRILDIDLTGKEINKMQFIGQKKLFFDLDGQINVVQLDLSNPLAFKLIPNSFPSSQTYTVSKDGDLFAFLNNSNIEIYNQNQTLISSIKLQSTKSQIQAMAFDTNNSLFLIDQNSTVTVFKRQNCLHGYTNQNGYCLCLRQYANYTDCKCYDNFIDQDDGTCLCSEPFVLAGQSCSCASGKYLAEGQCPECSFWCKECQGTSTSCTQYSAGFYGIVIGGSVLLLILIGVGIWLVLRKIKKPDAKKSDRSSLKKGVTEKSASDLLAEDTLEKPLRSQKSQTQ